MALVHLFVSSCIYFMTLLVGEKRKTREEIMREIKFAVDSLSEESYSILERLGKFMAVLVSFASRNKMNLASIFVIVLCDCFLDTRRFGSLHRPYTEVHSCNIHLLRTISLVFLQFSSTADSSR